MREKGSSRRLAATSLLLLLLALAALTALTAAWFSISDNTRVNSLNMDITTGASLRFDVVPHADFSQYLQTLSGEQLLAASAAQLGFNAAEAKLKPLTTTDAQRFTVKSGKEEPGNRGSYLSFTLHFMASEEMYVHLTTADSLDHTDGTRITSPQPRLPLAMRVSFSCGGKTAVYDPGTAESYQISEKMHAFGLRSAMSMEYNSDNMLFHIMANEDTPVQVCVWLEGTDEACTDELKNAEYTIQLRFLGTDENNVPI